MKILISPAKRMNTENDFFTPRQMPVFLEKTERLRQYLKGLSFEALKKLLECNDAIARLNYERYQTMDLTKSTNPALLSFDGIQYQYMAPQVFEDQYFEYAEKHLRILSGFYGVLKPFDAVVPYRLEVQTRLTSDFCKNLYDYWGADIYREVTAGEDTILNLASKGYNRLMKKYLTDDICYINCFFGEFIGSRVVEKGVYVKMARGEMVRFMAEKQIHDIQKIKEFDRLNFRFHETLSDERNFVFIREK